ncbi:MAG: tetratricopeptide repeat protein [Candidatus Atribacteria bacterium]|nr:tetratricopeptide repeat protein [Candidatus Atribacteria bacterium]
MYRTLWIGFMFFLLLSLTLPSLAEENIPLMVKKISPSIVVVFTYNESGDSLSQGSGFFINPQGDVITNRHVVENSSLAAIRTAQGKLYPIKRILAWDENMDLVILSVEIPAQEVIPLSISNQTPDLGERVIIIGSPLGFEQTISDGIVSAIREVEGYGKVLQTTAPISPGSSGSPIIDMRGEVIGIATFQMVDGQNLNFAIPGERLATLIPGKGMTLAEWTSQQTGGSTSSAEKAFNTGRSFVLAEEFKKALPYFEDAVKKDPQYADAYFEIGYCQLYSEKYQEAIKAFKKVLTLKPEDSESFFYLGMSYAELEDYQNAIKAYQESIRLNLNEPDAENNLARIYYHQQNYDEAIIHYQKAIAIKPDYALAYYNLGVLYSDVGKNDEAIHAYQESIRIDPQDPDALNNLGLIYLDREQYQEAKKYFQQAIDLNPDYNFAHFNLGRTYQALGEREKAYNEYKILKKIDAGLAEKLLDKIYQ